MPPIGLFGANARRSPHSYRGRECPSLSGVAIILSLAIASSWLMACAEYPIKNGFDQSTLPVVTSFFIGTNSQTLWYLSRLLRPSLATFYF
jgi:hypothetical protein